MPDTISLEPPWSLPVGEPPHGLSDLARFRAPLELSSAPVASRPTRHLPERILTAVHEACDLGALSVAVDLLRILETVVTDMHQTSPTARRRSMEGLVAAHDRIWHLRHERRITLDDPIAAVR